MSWLNDYSWHFKRQRLNETGKFVGCRDWDSSRLRNLLDVETETHRDLEIWRMLRPRLIETGKFAGCRDRDQSRLGKRCRYRDSIETLVDLWSWDLFAVSLAVAILRHFSRSRSCSARRSCWRSVSCSSLRDSMRIIFSLKSHLILRSHFLALDLREARKAETICPGSCFCLCNSVVSACIVYWFTHCLVMFANICSSVKDPRAAPNVCSEAFTGECGAILVIS